VVAISQSFGITFGTASVDVLESFIISFGTASVAIFALVRYGSGEVDNLIISLVHLQVYWMSVVW